jgi:hypothetical protein
MSVFMFPLLALPALSANCPLIGIADAAPREIAPRDLIIDLLLIFAIIHP